MLFSMNVRFFRKIKNNFPFLQHFSVYIFHFHKFMFCAKSMYFSCLLISHASLSFFAFLFVFLVRGLRNGLNMDLST